VSVTEEVTSGRVIPLRRRECLERARSPPLSEMSRMSRLIRARMRARTRGSLIGGFLISSSASDRSRDSRSILPGTSRSLCVYSLQRVTGKSTRGTYGNQGNRNTANVYARRRNIPSKIELAETRAAPTPAGANGRRELLRCDVIIKNQAGVIAG